MNILLEKGIILLSDETQFQLRKEMGVNKKNEQIYRTLGYYGTLEQALNGYVKYATRLSEATTLQELKADLTQIKEYIESMVVTIKKEESK